MVHPLVLALFLRGAALLKVLLRSGRNRHEVPSPDTSEDRSLCVIRRCSHHAWVRIRRIPGLYLESYLQQSRPKHLASWSQRFRSSGSNQECAGIPGLGDVHWSVCQRSCPANVYSGAEYRITEPEQRRQCLFLLRKRDSVR